MKYWTLNAGIHENCSTNCGPSIERSNMAKRARERAKETAVKRAAVSFIRLGLAPGSRAIIIAPMTGRKMIAER
jgi:hypothetical protein